jgi:hypothetical protein
MGQLTIEIPQNVNRFYQVKDSDFSERLLQNLEDFEKKMKSEKSSAIIPPRRNSLKKDLEEVFGIWKDRPESAEEIAREIRDKNRRKR